MPITPDLTDLLNSAEFHRLSVVKTGDQWQANLQRERGNNSFRVEFGDTAAEAIAALFEGATSDPVPMLEETPAPQTPSQASFALPLPPCPVALLPCPVPLPA